jgi:hypothetical protein
MSYPKTTEPNFLENLLSRKEFYSLKIDPEYNFRDPSNAVNLGPLAARYLRLHSHQLFVRNFMSPNTPFMRLHLLHGTGCHAAGTRVFDYTGRSVAVEDVKIGDYLLADNGIAGSKLHARRVLSRLEGSDDMYEITLLRTGETFKCNHDHVLTLKFGHKIIDMPLGVYLELPDYVRKLARMYRLSHIQSQPTDTSESPFNAGMAANRFVTIPDKFKYNSTANQLSYINGVLVGSGAHANAQTNTQTNTQTIHGDKLFLNDILYMCRCIGMYAYINSTNALIITDDDTTETFSVKHVGIEYYYGFTLDGNGRYVLDNFIVTHNSGKTLAAVSVANEFINVYKRMYLAAQTRIGIGRRYQVELDRATPSVFVLGFSGAKGAFIRELLDFPEFGFITISEHEQLTKLRTAAASGFPDDLQMLREHTNMIKRRIQNKSKDGFYKFFGYDEFVNRLFITDKISLTDVEARVNAEIAAGKSDITLESAIKEHIRAGDIQVNNALVAMFENSLMICDEIHNTYNSNTKNNRGVAIQYILDTVPTVRFLSMSATPVNNSPTEVVELINYLCPTAEKVLKSDLFANPKTLRDGALEHIGKLTYGRVSFLQKIDLKYFPKRIFMGEHLRIEAAIGEFSAGTEIPYLKFIQCPMSEFHQATYINYVNGENVDNPSNYYTVPTDGYSIYDIAFPNPESDKYGLFRSSDTRNKINSATQEWRDANKIMIKKFSSTNTIISGEFLHQNNLHKYSTKYAKMLEIIKNIIAASEGDPDRVQKIMIYHNRVKMSGVLLIQEILRENGFLDEISEPIDSTICAVCGRRRDEHSAQPSAKDGSWSLSDDILGAIGGNPTHNFIASRFVMVHFDIDATTREQSMSKFNMPENMHGEKYQILIGSKIMKESYNIKDTQNLIILSLPSDIPTLIQVIGRCIRTHSHVRLPVEQRKVDIYVLVSTINKIFAHHTLVSPELYRYTDKLNIYKVIQQIEREINRNAVDADVHRDITMSKEQLNEYFPNGDSAPSDNTTTADRVALDVLGNLYFSPSYVVPPLRADQLNLSTFTAYKHYNNEINTITYIIKRLFMINPIYTYDELFAATKRPPIGLEVNPALFAESNFIIALEHLVAPGTQIVSAEKVVSTESYFMERLFDHSEKYIYINRTKHQIVQIDKYYILFPVATLPDVPINVAPEDTTRDPIINMRVPVERALIDVETYLRPSTPLKGVTLSIKEFVSRNKSDINYSITRATFIEKFTPADDCTMFNMLTEYSASFQRAILEEIIIDVFSGNESYKAGLYKKILELYNKFKVIIYLPDIIKYKDVTKHYTNGPPNLPNDAPIGYISAKSVRLYDKEWFEVSKIALNRQITYKENDTIIGYFEDAPDHMKFKLRKPVQFIREDIRRDIMAKQSKSELDYLTSRPRSHAITGDTRLVERGIVCSTKNKYELLKILANLGVSISKLDRAQIRIKKLCWMIRMQLIDNEIKERQRDTKNKWLYSWFDQQPSLI